jgi:phenylacetyl-CoA:acceptor oxidoreductase subunit 1
MPRWGMVIDLRKCIGCATCVEVCIQDHIRPPVAQRKLIVSASSNQLSENRLFITMSCMHCDRPSCQETCPSGATYKRADGIVEIRENLCIGCGACIVACAYGARSICNEDVICIKEPSGNHEKDNSTGDRIGICTKCNFCSQIIDAGIHKGLKPGKDPEATPLCVRYCIAEALYFGDLDDPESCVSKLIRENKTVRFLEDQETSPKTYYIVK